MDELLGAAQLAEQAHRYDEASKLYRRALGRPAAREPGARLPVLDRAAASERKARRHDEAFALHYEAIALKGRAGATAGQFLISYTEMITDKYLASRFDQALEVLAQARAQLAGALSDEATGLLLKMEAYVHYCKGDFPTAAASMNAGRGLSEPHTPAGPQKLMDVLRHKLYITCERSRLEAEAGGPTPGTRRLAESERSLVRTLVAHGPWADPLQLPNGYTPGLTARPWHRATDWPQLAPLVRHLERNHAGLVTEYRRLRDGGKMLADQDCIQHGGAWARFEITGVGSELDPGTGCSTLTPVACRMLRACQADGSVAILRAGWSALQPRTWIKPHYGMSNTKLKLHLGVVIPVGCAEMRVANETRPWEEGKVLLFDDSFEHEVHNRCEQERVVFQLVVRHPDIPSDPRYAAVVVDSH